ncbi:MAG: hypothetical protein SFY32_03250 [Bacteroidota bacterium]|nr:hypothetical protein [Bacteroidota bacterium]
MKYGYWMWKGAKFLATGVALIALLGWVIMSLWNWLIPTLFSGPVIGYWQAMGLFVLAKIFFGFGRGGGWGGGMGRHQMWKQKMEARFGNMTPEEKERFKQQMKQRWGGRCGGYYKPDEKAEVEQSQV